jgi:type I restriction enzyme S subunit
MSKIDEIIQELCPEGVRHLTLADLAIIGTGSSDKKDADPDGQFPFYVRSKEVFRAQTSEFDETAILIPGEGGIGEIFHFQNGPYALHQRAYRVSPYSDAIDPKFLYFFMVNNFRSHIMQKAVSATVTSIRKPMIESFSVALPPLEVQKEIVSILDKFTQLEAELEAELEARRTQYEVTRDRLLNFSSDLEDHPLSKLIQELCPEGVRRVQIKDLMTRGKGVPVTATQMKTLTKGDALVRVFAGGQTFVDVDSNSAAGRVAHQGPGIIVRSRGIIAFTYWEGRFTHKNELWSYLPSNDLIDIKFVYYFLTSKTQQFIDLAKSKSVKMPQLTVDDTDLYQIPHPPLEVQKEIVSILDKLDALVNDISIGLPAEIAARRKQYEYHRNKLLTFKELDAA